MKPVIVTTYSLVDLQAATGSFSATRLLGQGTIGNVYKAKCADGKVLAVKKIDLINLSGGTSYDFMELISGISKLHHPNIAELLGYCSDPWYHLLIYEFQMNGSLHDFLHLSDEYGKPLTWDTRVRIALGTARAVDSKPIMEQSLVRWAAPQLHDINALAQMADPSLRGLYLPQSLSLFADVIALCIQSEPEFHPPMSEVLQSLDQCVHRTGIDKKSGLSTSCRIDDSESFCY